MSMQKQVVAVVMGGGRGTRLFPLTSERCKPAVPLAGKYRLLDIPVSNCINSEINRIFVLTQFHTASLHRHIQNAYHFDQFGGGFVEILSAEQTEKTSDWYQGTADAVRRNLQHLRHVPHDYVLILSGDQLYRMDFRKIIAQHAASGAEVTIAAIPFPVSKIEGLGLLRVDDKLAIQQFAEKPKDPAVIKSLEVSPALEATLQGSHDEPHCLASMGIYVFNRAALAEALAGNEPDFGKEIIPGLLGKKKLHAYIFEGYWEDIGTVRAFFDANLAVANPLPPFNFFDPEAPIYTQDRYLPASKLNKCDIDHVVIGDGSILTNSSVRHSVLGVRSHIGEGSRLEDVVMMGADYYETADQQSADAAQGLPAIGVGRGCHIHRTIIDKNARVGDFVRLSPAGRPDGNHPHGIIIRDGVLVVPKGAVVPNGTVI
jgi:glucose-1-phosphate adenylyltransferase